MAEQSLCAKLGLRLAIVGSAASLAIAAPILNAGSQDTTAHTAANRTGIYFDQTAGAETIGFVCGGVSAATLTSTGALVNLSVSPNTDNTLTSGYGMMGFAVGGTATRFYIAQASCYNSTDYGFQQSSAGQTKLNCKTGQSVILAINNTSILTGSALGITISIPIIGSDTTDATSGTTGSINTLGGIGITKAVWVGTTCTIGTNCIVSNGTITQSVNDSATNTVVFALDLTHLSTGTVAANFGVGIQFRLEDDSGSSRQAGGVQCFWSDAATATRTSAVRLITVNSAGAQTTTLTVAPTAMTLVSTATFVAQNVTDTSSGTTGAINTLGGVGITKAVWIGTNCTLANGVISQTVDDAATATLTAVATFNHTSTGTTANGFGSTITINGEDAGGSLRNQCLFDAYWVTAASATRTSALQLRLVSAGVVVSPFVFSPSVTAGTTPSLSITGTSTITGGVTDGYNGSIRLAPTYDAATALTVTRHNYIDVPNVLLTGAGPAALTDACIFRFNAAPGTHSALAADGIVAVTFTGVGPTGAQTTIQGWMKINVNGTLRYVPFW